MSKEIKTTYLVRISGDTNSTLMYRINDAGKKEAINRARNLLDSMPYDMAEVWHFDTLKLVAAIVKRDNPDLK